jgi:hypothetical protein
MRMAGWINSLAAFVQAVGKLGAGHAEHADDGVARLG